MNTYVIREDKKEELHKFLNSQFEELHKALKHRHKVFSGIKSDIFDLDQVQRLKGIEELEKLQDQMIRTIRALDCPFFGEIRIEDSLISMFISGTKFF